MHEWLRYGARARTGYRNSDGLQLLELVRRLVDERPGYGYRRSGAPLEERGFAVSDDICHAYSFVTSLHIFFRSLGSMAKRC